MTRRVQELESRGRNSSKGHADDDGDAIEILEACYFHLEIWIKVLTQKSLITINEDGKFDMHDLAQDMAHDIVRGEQPNHPENHSRIWNYEAMDTCLRDATKSLPLLKVLELHFMPSLLRTPDFDGLPRLQKLTLSACLKLKEIHPSLGNHKSLEYVHVSSCKKLRKFPTIVHMGKLQILKIVSCNKIVEFPEIQANMESLVNLTLKEVFIELLPSSIAKRCTNLTSLYLVDLYELKSVEFNFGAFKNLEELTFAFRPSKMRPLRATLLTMFYQFPRSLRKLDLSGSCIVDGKILSGIVELSNLEELDLSWNILLSRLDFSLLQLTRLKILNLTSCESLVELPELPSSMACLIADGCHSLEVIGDSLTNCKWLCQVSNVKGSIINEGSSLLESMLWGNGGIENGVLQIKGVEIAKELIATGFCVGRRSYHDNIDIDVSWKEEQGEYWTWVGYVSFASLIHTSWWDQSQTYTALSFSIENVDINCRRFGVTLVKRESDPTATATASSQFSHENSGRYTPAFNIVHDSAVALYFTLGMKSY